MDLKRIVMDNFIIHEYEWLTELSAEPLIELEKIGVLRFKQKK